MNLIRLKFLCMKYRNKFQNEEAGLTRAQVDFICEALELHNNYRESHLVPPLLLNVDICKVSQKWATRLAGQEHLEFSNNRKFGENIYCGWTDDGDEERITARVCIDQWYSEIVNYRFTEEPDNMSCGHFTQIVWKESRELGVGLAKSTQGRSYVVCNYFPRGNVNSRFRDNVLAPNYISFSPNTKSIIFDAKSTKVGPPVLNKDKPTTSKPPDKKPPEKKPPVPQPPKPFEPSKPVEPKDKFEKDFLKAHNDYRKKHGVPPLYLTQKLNDFALVWAKKLAETGQMKHRDQQDYGENIFFSWTNDPNYVLEGNVPVDNWYSEIKDFNFEKEDLTKKIGHFTQVVWEDTKEVGLGMAKAKDGKIFVVANYSPPGNFRTKFLEKVHKPKP